MSFTATSPGVHDAGVVRSRSRSHGCARFPARRVAMRGTRGHATVLAVVVARRIEARGRHASAHLGHRTVRRKGTVWRSARGQAAITEEDRLERSELSLIAQ